MAGRTYHYFGSKDAGKTGVSSKEVVYMIAVGGPQGDTNRLAQQGKGWWSVERAWEELANYVQGTASVAKMAARIELAFSGTVGCFGERQFNCWKGLKREGGGSMAAVMAACEVVGAAACGCVAGCVAGGGGAIDVIEMDDIYGSCGVDGGGVEGGVEGGMEGGMEGGVEGGVDDGGSGPGQVMTDGTGLISSDLMADLTHEIKQQHGKDWQFVPLLVQVRLWYDGSLAKGTLFASAALPPRTIVLRDSMVKVSAGDGGGGGGGGGETGGGRGNVKFGRRGTLEVVGRQAETTNESNLSNLLVPLLELGGKEPMVSTLLELQKAAVEETARVLEFVSGGQELSKDQVDVLLRLILSACAVPDP